MRKLGGQLGVEAMSLYRYVSSKEDLLSGLVDPAQADGATAEVMREQARHLP
jgi:TetR/AcrR family transcriptional regulator, tetracycline repressor protein